MGLAGHSVGDVTAALSQTVVTHLDSTPKTYGACARAYGARVAEAIGDAMEAGGMKRAAILYVTEGIDLSLDDSQEGLTQIAESVPELAEVCEQLKSIGRVTAPRWQAVGLDALPSEAEIVEALAAIADTQAVATFFNETLNQLVSSGAGKEQIKSAVAAW